MKGGNPKYTFYTDQVSYTIETKDNDKKYYVSGYITTEDRDLVNDIVTKEAMEDMMKQLQGRTIKIDIEHEAVTDSNAVIPVGKIVHAVHDEKGIWVKVELNKYTKRFPEIWNSIKAKFIDAFSITYTPIKYVHKMIEGVKTRMLQQINLINVALTGVPVNPAARIDGVMMKSLEEMEETQMAEEETIETPVEETQEEATVEEKTEEVVKEPEEQPEAEIKGLVELKNELKSIRDEIAALHKKFDKPMLKAVAPGKMPEAKNEVAAPTEVTEQSVEQSTVQQPEIKPLDMI